MSTTTPGPDFGHSAEEAIILMFLVTIVVQTYLMIDQ